MNYYSREKILLAGKNYYSRESIYYSRERYITRGREILAVYGTRGLPYINHVDGWSISTILPDKLMIVCLYHFWDECISDMQRNKNMRPSQHRIKDINKSTRKFISSCHYSKVLCFIILFIVGKLQAGVAKMFLLFFVLFFSQIFGVRQMVDTCQIGVGSSWCFCTRKNQRTGLWYPYSTYPCCVSMEDLHHLTQPKIV